MNKIILTNPNLVVVFCRPPRHRRVGRPGLGGGLRRGTGLGLARVRGRLADRVGGLLAVGRRGAGNGVVRASGLLLLLGLALLGALWKKHILRISQEPTKKKNLLKSQSPYQ